MPLDDVIITFATERLRHHPSADYRSNLAFYHGTSRLGPLPKVDRENMGAPVLARVDLGRWLVDCFACASAVIIEDTDLFFICPTCGSDGRWSEVVLPAERAEIEEILLRRPGFREANRNRFWFPGESVEDLVMENFRHNVPVPEKHMAWLEEKVREILEAEERT